MKKLIVLLMSAVMVFSLAACGGKDGLNVYMPDGAPALALAYMMDSQSEVNGEKLNYGVVPSDIGDYVRNEEADIIVIPANAAVGLYNQGAKYNIAAVVTHGNLFLAGKSAETLADLKGGVVGTFGKNQIPDLVFKALLKLNDIEFVEGNSASAGKVTLYYGDSVADAKGFLKAEVVDFAFLAEPVVTGTVAELSASGVKVLFDIQEEWAAAMNAQGKDYSNGFPQAVLMVKSSLNKTTVSDFLAKCKEGDGWAESEPAAAVAAIKAHPIKGKESNMPPVNSGMIARSNIKTVTEGLESYVGDFLRVLKNTLEGVEGVSGLVVPKDVNIYYSAE